MGNGENDRPFELEERAFVFARDVRSLLKQLPRTLDTAQRDDVEAQRQALVREATELVNILSTIITRRSGG